MPESCEPPSLVLLCAVYVEHRTPPAPRSTYLLQVSGPEQPGSPVCKAHIYDYVLIPPVATHNLANQASALLYPVMVSHPHSHARAHILWLHDYQLNAPGRAEKYIAHAPTPGRVRRRALLGMQRTVSTDYFSRDGRRYRHCESAAGAHGRLDRCALLGSYMAKVEPCPIE